MQSLMNLFVAKEFIAHSGQPEKFKIECDALSDGDIDTLVMIIDEKFKNIGIKFANVFGVPTGGVRIAKAFEKYLDPNSSFVLVLDDVLTTGRSMKDFRDSLLIKLDKPILGCVLFDRSNGKGPDWVHSVFRM